MTADLHLAGPTVTMFGDHDALDDALSVELSRRGCSIHTVTTPVGWLTSAAHAVIRLDTSTGQQAILELADRVTPATHVVAVGVEPAESGAASQLRRLCRRAAEHHDVSLIWHPPIDATLAASSVLAAAPGELAVEIADEVGHQQAWTTAPSYAERTFEPGRHRGHP